MRFLIAGGAGSVGQDLTALLLAEGHAVRVLDKRAESFPRPHDRTLELVQGTLDDAALVREALREVDTVVDLAWSFSDDPVVLVESDLKGHAVLLEACATARISRLLYASTAVVYGKPVQVPITEEAPSLVEDARKPFYAVAKLGGGEARLGVLQGERPAGDDLPLLVVVRIEDRRPAPSRHDRGGTDRPAPDGPGRRRRQLSRSRGHGARASARRAGTRHHRTDVQSRDHLPGVARHRADDHRGDRLALARRPPSPPENGGGRPSWPIHGSCPTAKAEQVFGYRSFVLASRRPAPAREGDQTVPTGAGERLTPKGGGLRRREACGSARPRAGAAS